MSIKTSDKARLQEASNLLKLRVSNWESREILKDLIRSDISLPEEHITDRKGFFWNAMLTEYDAINFSKHLEASPCELSSEFLEFKRVWSRDEWNHYIGFRSIYSVLYNHAEHEIAAQIENEKGDFRSIEEFSDDEFKICLLLAYDEIATSKSYFSEFPLYRAFGNPVFLNWFKKVTVDELYHFLNCMELIKHCHSSRIPEIADTIDMFIEYDMHRNEYKRTFVFDHYWYSRAFLEHCRDLIVSYFKNGLRGTKFATKVEKNKNSPFYDKYIYL